MDEVSYGRVIVRKEYIDIEWNGYSYWYTDCPFAQGRKFPNGTSDIQWFKMVDGRWKAI